ncbi:helix-turn-helix domain-containing protein [Aestuariispira insulae]|uniref:Xre family transcriptional regulator n=1 Tax=Aestuariispira insulae TaxID=1461337 RepID=A0A3D9HRN3_9PROT|nr:helix-turn-helix transcriptional regulator [Aestuariispira insulae]RED52152.1 Xre family transcriptional regulator [Aestuariispira insulae]
MSEIVRNQKQLGQVLRFHRQKKGLNQADVATKANLRQSTISDIENGIGGTITTICEIMRVLDIEMEIRPRSKLTSDDLLDML